MSFFWVYSAQAQGGAFGAKATPMMSYSKLMNNDTYTFEGTGTMPGIAFGPSYKKYFGDNCNVDIGVLFSWQGVKYQATPVASGNGLTTLNIQTFVKYFEIPVILDASFPISGGLKGVMDFGVTPVIELSSLADVYDNNEPQQLLKSPYDYAGTPVNLYLNAGAGVSYDVTDVLMISGVVMYNHGILDVWYDETDAEYIPELDLKNHTVSLNIGVHIKF